jgi:hypothetical protein
LNDSGFQALNRCLTGLICQALLNGNWQSPAYRRTKTWREAVDRAQKAEFITSLRDSVQDAGAVVVAHYTGLSVGEM